MALERFTSQPTAGTNRTLYRPMLDTSFSTTGYVVLPALLNEAALCAARAAVDLALSGHASTGMNRVGNELVPLRWCDPIVSIFLKRTDAISAVHQAVGASDLKWISAYVTSKAPYSPPLFWHQDWWCWDHPISFDVRAPQIAVLCYLSATNVETGALRVIPGSHRRIDELHHHLPDPHSAQAHTLAHDHVAMMDCPGQETVTLAPGDAVVIDYRLLHGTHANMAGFRRDALLLSFAPAWRMLPQALRAHIAMHPALPCPREWPSVPKELQRLLARYRGRPRSLQINRTVPLSAPEMRDGNFMEKDKW